MAHGLALTTDVERGTVQAALSDGLVIVALLVVGGLVAVLPGAGRAIPGTTVTIGTLISTSVWLGVVTAILHATPSVGALVRAAIEGPQAVVADLAAAARYVLVFLAILVAYAGLAPLTVQLLAPGSAWMYDVAFLGFALFPVLAIGHRLYRNADPIAEELARSLVGPTSPDVTPDASEP